MEVDGASSEKKLKANSSNADAPEKKVMRAAAPLRGTSEPEWKCGESGQGLMRRMFASEMECDGCGELIEAKTKRLMCVQEACAYHICKGCKQIGEGPGVTMTDKWEGVLFGFQHWSSL